MRSDGTHRALETIVRNIGLARAFVEGSSPEQFATDAKTIYAVTRCLEIISEASRRIPTEAKARHPLVPWDRIAGAGNIYRHDYEDVLAEIIWNTVVDEMEPLETAIRTELKKLKDR